MPLVRFPSMMKYYFGDQSEIFISGATVAEVIKQIVEAYPSVSFHLLDSSGNLRRHFNIFVNGTHIRDLNGMETQINEEDRIILMASAAGG